LYNDTDYTIDEIFCEHFYTGEKFDFKNGSRESVFNERRTITKRYMEAHSKIELIEVSKPAQRLSIVSIKCKALGIN